MKSVESERDTLRARYSQLQSTEAKEQRQLEELQKKNRSLEKSLTQTMSTCSEDELDTINRTRPEFEKAKVLNAGLHDEVKKLREALKMIRAEGAEMAKDEADSVLADSWHEFQNVQEQYSSIKKATVGRKKWDLTSPRSQSRLASVVTAAQSNEEVQKQELMRLETIRAKRDEHEARERVQVAQVAVEEIESQLGQLPGESAINMRDGEDEGAKLYKQYMQAQRTRKHTQQESMLQTSLKEAKNWAQEATENYDAKRISAALLQDKLTSR